MLNSHTHLMYQRKYSVTVYGLCTEREGGVMGGAHMMMATHSMMILNKKTSRRCGFL